LLGAREVGSIGASAALQLEVLADGVVQQAHVPKGYSPRTLAVSACAFAVRFLPSLFAA
jgi:hypothetical protein